MNINPDNAQDYQHREWLSHPMTQQLLKNLGVFREKFIINASALVFQEAPDRVIFSNLGSLRNIDAVVKMINDTNVFLQKDSQTNQQTKQTT